MSLDYDKTLKEEIRKSSETTKQLIIGALSQIGIVLGQKIDESKKKEASSIVFSHLEQSASPELDKQLSDQLGPYYVPHAGRPQTGQRYAAQAGIGGGVQPSTWLDPADSANRPSTQDVQNSIRACTQTAQDFNESIQTNGIITEKDLNDLVTKNENSLVNHYKLKLQPGGGGGPSPEEKKKLEQDFVSRYKLVMR